MTNIDSIPSLEKYLECVRGIPDPRLKTVHINMITGKVTLLDQDGAEIILPDESEGPASFNVLA